MIAHHFHHPAKLGLLLAAILLLGPTRPARGEQDPVVVRGVGFLKNAVSGSNAVGETALGALAMIKAEVPASDPSLSRAIGLVLSRFGSSSYVPASSGGPEIYEACVIILALSSLDAVSYKSQIDAAARHIIGQQKGNGSWDYAGREKGDTSISQYAVLGLWEAEIAGVSIPPSVWDNAAKWYLSSQSGGGSWNYHRDESGPETVAMTAAGVGSLLICERQLAPYRLNVRNLNPFLIPLDSEADRKKYTPDVSAKRVTSGIQLGLTWLTANFKTGNTGVIGKSPFYALYGIERIGALADSAMLGKRDWYEDGKAFLTAKQGGDGSFAAEFGTIPNTSWAVLFLTKSTAKTMRKIQLRKLGAGTLIGGRGLPKDLSSISVAGGHVIARPMDGAVEGMLAVLEDPRVEDASSALAGLISRYRTEGPKALRPFQDRFRRLLTDQDQGIRRVAAWSLARTGDVSMALLLIDALKDPDEGVVDEARLGLQLLSRKIEGYGPLSAATPEQKNEAMVKWRAWYETVRPTTTGDSPSSGKPTVPGRRLP